MEGVTAFQLCCPGGEGPSWGHSLRIPIKKSTCPFSNFSWVSYNLGRGCPLGCPVLFSWVSYIFGVSSWMSSPPFYGYPTFLGVPTFWGGLMGSGLAGGVPVKTTLEGGFSPVDEHPRGPNTWGLLGVPHPLPLWSPSATQGP